MRILYIFPHPDDESFGPAPVMHQQIKNGHEVFLLTLTKGGATKVRFKLSLSIKAMGDIRFAEMQCVEKVPGVPGMTVLDLPDSGLQEMDPREIEKILMEHIKEIKPQLIISYPVHGISGFHDHLVMHTVVKRVFLEMRDAGADYLKRLAFLTLPNKTVETMTAAGMIMKQSDPSLIDCEISLADGDVEILKSALKCYETYRETIEKSGVIEKIGKTVYFEIYGEDHKPVLTDLTQGL